MTSAEKLKISTPVVWVLYTGLLLVQSYYTLIAPPLNKEPNAVVWVFCMLPLAAFLPWMIKQVSRAYIGLCFVLLLYFLLATVNAVRPDFGYSAYLELFFSTTLFIVAMMHARWLQRVRAGLD